jgi:hypothetical protein
MAKIPKISIVLVVGLIATLASGIPLKIRKGELAIVIILL